MTADPKEAGSASARQRTLLIYVPGLGGRRSDANPLLERLRIDLDLDVKCWDHGLRWWSTADMTATARRLAIQTRAWMGEHEVSPRYDRLILVGHSVGGVLVRNAYLLDAGKTAEHEPAHAWTGAVHRMVLLAAPNAGFHSRRLPWPARVGYTVSSPLSRFTVEQLRAGSDYITELRLRWVKAARSEPAGPGGRPLPTVVQVLGDRDRYVYRDECLDIDYIPNSVVVEVPNTTHDDLPRIDERAAPYRYELIRHALATRFDDSVLDRRDPPKTIVPDPAKPLAILLHGIRTERFLAWMPELAKRLQKSSPGAPLGMDVYAPTYGYFSAVDFAVPGLRRRNTRRFLGWYCDQYVLRKPGTQIHFAGHSNGTYMLGHALRRVPAVRFDNVFLAASVLPREYPWHSSTAQVGRVRSVCGTGDWVVALCCSALRGLTMRDIGTGGFHGFDEEPPNLKQERVIGGHGAALKMPQQLDDIASFLCSPPESPLPCGPRPDPNTAWAFVGRLVYLAALPAVAGAGYIGVRRALDADPGAAIAFAVTAFGLVCIGGRAL